METNSFTGAWPKQDGLRTGVTWWHLRLQSFSDSKQEDSGQLESD